MSLGDMLSSLFGASGPSTPPAANMPSATPDDPAAAIAQMMKEEQASRPYDLLLKLGLGLMASKNPSLAGALGEAGASAMQGQEDAGTKALKRYMLQQQVGEAGQKATDRQTLRKALADDQTLSPAQRTLIMQNPEAAKTYVERSLGPGFTLLDGTPLGGPLGGNAAPEMPATGGTTTTVKPSTSADPASFAPDLDMKIGMLEEKYGLEPGSFRSLVQNESSGRQTLPNGQVNTSPAGALGLTQLMPGTAKDLGVDPTNPDQNLEGGARYLKQQMDKYGSLDRALIAYNWGPGNTDAWIKAGADPAKLPAETRAYLANNLGVNAAPVQVADAGTTATDASPAAAPQRFVGQGVRAGAAAPTPAAAPTRVAGQGVRSSEPQPFMGPDRKIVSGWGIDPATGRPVPLNDTGLTPDQKNYAAAVRDGGYSGNFNQWLLDQKKASKTETNVTVNGDNSLQKSLGEKMAGDIFSQRDIARSAVSQLSTIDEAKKLLDSGIISGSGAGWKLALDKALSGIGLSDGNKVANTEAFVSAMGGQTLALVKALGAGSGISNADRDFAEKVAGGNIDLNEASIRRIIDINERAAQSAVERYNGSVKPLLDDQQTPAALRQYLPITSPQRNTAAPPSQPAAGGAAAQRPAQPGGTQQPQQGASTTRTMNGRTYVRVGDQWYEQP